ncbi:MAG: DNA polymerase III subunit gamma/tau [Clostridiales bacterium]|jgi:DNA polymerase-3 subunit gamma/tau|nr:DNA polymerase III subunit gamma/tau [Clostridiales bacterium]
MGYTALYRKYRPRTFDDVIGQDFITVTLKNQIKSGRVGHAYLFAGSRGTGKTSCAKIFARAVNCQNADGNPCGECDVCKGLANENNMDILEIDAASNNKVDEIRELREKAQYLPVCGKYKVYIVDEVHMLTDSAFNALLKTLEEPPAHVIFILATTEVHKLPATILSRCLRFDFRLVPGGELTERLKKVYKSEGKKYEDDALKFIAECAEGSVRDCLSIADMCLNYKDGPLTLFDVQTILGAADKSKTAALFNAVAASRPGDALLCINELASLGKSMSLIAKELTKYARDLLVIKTTGEALIVDTKENLEVLRRESEAYSVDLLSAVIEIFSAIDAELRYSVSPKIVLEAAAIRACKLCGTDLSALEERVRRLESGVIAPQRPSLSEPTAAPLADGANKPTDAKSIWGRMTTLFRNGKQMALYALVGGHTDYEIDGDKLAVYAADEKFMQFNDPAIADAINKALLVDKVNLTLDVRRRASDVDMDGEINKIKRLIGDAKLNVKQR